MRNVVQRLTRRFAGGFGITLAVCTCLEASSRKGDLRSRFSQTWEKERGLLGFLAAIGGLAVVVVGFPVDCLLRRRRARRA